MYLDRTYRPRRRRRSFFERFWWLILAGVIGIILYEQQPAWLAPRLPAPTAIPTRSAVSFLADADIAYRSGEIDDAIAAYEQVMRLEPNNAKPLAALSALYLIMNDVDKAYEFGRRAVDLAPKDPTALTALARVSDWRAEYDAAVNQALDSLEIDPKNATTLAVLGEIYTDVGNPGVAEDYLNQALEIDPQNVMALRNRAYFEETRGNYTAAVESYQKAIEAAPYRFDLYLEKGRQYQIGLLDYDAAIDAYRKAADAYRAPVTLTVLGAGLYNAGDHLQAVRVLQEALEMDPNYGPALVNLGMALYARRNYEDAAINLEKGLPLVGDKARVEQFYTAGLANIYKDPTDCDRAEPWLRKALEMDATSGPALEGLRLCNR